MKYMPLIKSMNRISSAPLGDKHTISLFDNIESAGGIQYKFLLGVFDNEKQEPVYFVASEINGTAATFGGGSHYLGVFSGTGHANMGSSDDWGDLQKFSAEATRLVTERFGVTTKRPP